MAQILKSFEEEFQRLDPALPLYPFRTKGWEQLIQQGLPTKDDEAFSYLFLKELFQESFVVKSSKHKEGSFDQERILRSVFPESRHSYLTFIDGQFSKELSDCSGLPSHTVLTSLDEAFHSHRQFLQASFSRVLKQEKDPFALLNLSFHSQGMFLYLPPSTRLQAPVQCLFFSSPGFPRLISPRLHFVLGKHSEGAVIFTPIGDSSEDLDTSSHLFIPYTEVFLEEGADLQWFHSPSSPLKMWQFETVRAQLKQNARLKTLNITQGEKVFRQSYHVQLKGENSEVELKGLSALSHNRTAHTHVVVEHQAPHTRSQQLFKGVLSDTSQSSFEGKIFVHKSAQKTESYQLNRNLVLSPGAVANSKPNLEIFADDVKASHGATVSQLEPNHLLYLQTRGILPQQARCLLIEGFCREVLEDVPYPSLRLLAQSITEKTAKRV